MECDVLVNGIPAREGNVIRLGMWNMRAIKTEFVFCSIPESGYMPGNGGLNPKNF
jgi:hypothetical protein